MQIKHIIKFFNNKDAQKSGVTNCDLAYKFDFIYKDIVHDFNAITKWDGLEQSGEETTWGNGGFGKKGSGITGRITG